MSAALAERAKGHWPDILRRLGLPERRRPRRPRSAMPRLRRTRSVSVHRQGFWPLVLSRLRHGRRRSPARPDDQAGRLPDSRRPGRDGGRQSRRPRRAQESGQRQIGQAVRSDEAVARGGPLPRRLAGRSIFPFPRTRHHQDRGTIAPLRCELVSLAIKVEVAGCSRPDHSRRRGAAWQSYDLRRAWRGRQSASRAAAPVRRRRQDDRRRRLVRQGRRAFRVRRRRRRRVPA